MERNNELVPIEKAAERLGTSRATLWRRVKELHLTIYTSPLDKRKRLLDWAEVDSVMRPQKIHEEKAS
jgi:predicted DNA-binding transcriptional regulator AlpA